MNSLEHLKYHVDFEYTSIGGRHVCISVSIAFYRGPHLPAPIPLQFESLRRGRYFFLVQGREDEALQIEEGRFDGDSQDQGQQRHGQQRTQVLVDMVEFLVVDGFALVGVIESDEVEMDQVEAVR